MSLLLEDLIKMKFDQDEKLLAGKAMVIRANNVAQYLYLTPDKKWSASDFPCIASPAPIMWIEWRQNFIDEPPGRCGLLAGTNDFEEVKAVKGLEEWLTLLARLEVKPRWITTSNFYYESGDGYSQVRIRWAVSTEGSPIKDGLIVEAPEDTPDEAKHQVTSIITVPWMTLSFMNCKNVELIKSSPAGPKLLKVRAKKNIPPPIRWHVLNIEPFKKMVNTAYGRKIERLDPAALHICRGHFKDFTERGLFGKNKGIYWWPMTLRGSSEQGIVNKDYEVKI